MKTAAASINTAKRTSVGVSAVRTIAAGKFKAMCLAVMGEVQAKRQAVVIT